MRKVPNCKWLLHCVFASLLRTQACQCCGGWDPFPPFFPQHASFPPFNPSLHLPQRSVLEPCGCLVWWVIFLPFHVAEGEESSSIRWCHLVIYHVCTERQSDVYS